MICEEQLGDLAKVIGEEVLLGYIYKFEQEGLQIIDESVHLNYLENSEEIWQLLHKLSGTATTLGLFDFCELVEDVQKNIGTYNDKLEELSTVLKKNVNEANIFLHSTALR